MKAIFEDVMQTALIVLFFAAVAYPFYMAGAADRMNRDCIEKQPNAEAEQPARAGETR